MRLGDQKKSASRAANLSIPGVPEACRDLAGSLDPDSVDRIDAVRTHVLGTGGIIARSLLTHRPFPYPQRYRYQGDHEHGKSQSLSHVVGVGVALAAGYLTLAGCWDVERGNFARHHCYSVADFVGSDAEVLAC